jgi:hypothetical protein
MTDAELIRALGGGAGLAAALTQASGVPIGAEAVYKWARRGIAARWRPWVVQVAVGRGWVMPAVLALPPPRGGRVPDPPPLPRAA